MSPGWDRGKDYWTPPRVRLFSQAIQLSDFPAKVVKVLQPTLADCESVLDVGAGVGSLTVPISKCVPQVTALEPSPTMLEELRANLARNHLENVTCLQAAWGEIEIAPHDLVLVANVAPIFENFLGFLTAAEPLALHAVALVQNVGPGGEKFYLGELYPLLRGQSYPEREDYLRTLALLHSLGIYANVQIVAYQFDQPFATWEEAVDFWTGQLRLTEPEQRERLLTFLQTRLYRVGGQLIAPMRRRSAVIWWQVAPREST